MAAEPPLKHKPFSSLRHTAAPGNAPAARTQPAPQEPLLRLVVREQFDPQEHAAVARIIGVPPKRLSSLGAQLREAIGCKVVIEGRELLALTDACDDVAQWLRGAGAPEVVVVRRPTPQQPPGRAGGTLRAEIRRGLRVAIVMKADQESGVLTEGVVCDILTSSAVHPRGVKVRLESGEVGRVRRILG